MTARHYRMFAEALARTRPQPGGISYTQWLIDVRVIADIFANSSGKFDRNRFMDAAGAVAPLELLAQWTP